MAGLLVAPPGSLPVIRLHLATSLVSVLAALSSAPSEPSTLPVLLALKFLYLCFQHVWTDWGISCNSGLELLGRGSEELAVDFLDACDPSDAVGILQFAAICGALLGCSCCVLLGTAGFSLVCSLKEAGSASFVLRAFTASSLWQISLKLGYVPYFGSYLLWPFGCSCCAMDLVL